MSSSAGVSELMDAEKKASTVVAEARAARSDRLNGNSLSLLGSLRSVSSPTTRSHVTNFTTTNILLPRPVADDLRVSVL